MSTRAFSLWRLFGFERHHQLLLIWFLLTGVALFAFVVAVRYGLVARVFDADKSYISVAISLLYIVTSLHCMVQTVFISRQLNGAGASARELEEAPSSVRLDGERLVGADGDDVTKGVVAEHIRDLIVKARMPTGRLDQTLLLGSFENRLKGPQEIGFFISDMMLRLGLLGTVIGFILMLAPLAAIQAVDMTAMREVLSSMSDGMAVALFTTLSGLIGGILLKLQYFFLESSTDELVSLTTELTEVYVVPMLESVPMETTRHAA